IVLRLISGLKGCSRPLTLRCGQYHGPSRDEASAGGESTHPGAETERLVQMHIHAAESEGHGMDAVGRASRRAQVKSAIEQRVIGLETVKRPIALVLRVRAGRAHPARSGHR